MVGVDTQFTGSIPGLYDRHLGPLLFQPYAEEVALRAKAFNPGHVLETAAGTGIVTAALHQALPDAEIIATDLNPAMLDVAAQRIRSDKVSFEPADALDLRFADDSFDLVVCQFGVMFFPDKVRGNAEARRVLRGGGQYVVAIWDRLDLNPVSKTAEDAVAELFPDDPPRFLERTPFGYADPARIEDDLRAAGFTAVKLETVPLSSGVDARDAAKGLVMGSPFRSEIEQRDPSMLDPATDHVAEALARWDGGEGPMSAHIVTATK